MTDVILTHKNELKEAFEEILDKRESKNSSRVDEKDDKKSDSIWSKFTGKKDDKPSDTIVAEALKEPLKNDKTIIDEIKENNHLLKKIDKKLKKLLSGKVKGHDPRLSFDNNIGGGKSSGSLFKTVKGLGKADQTIKPTAGGGLGLLDLAEGAAAWKGAKSLFQKAPKVAPKVPNVKPDSWSKVASAESTVSKLAPAEGVISKAAPAAIEDAGMMSKGLGTAGKIAGKVAVPLTGLVAGYDKYSQIKDDKNLNGGQKTAQVVATGGGAMAGAAGGAMAGAALGSVVPIVGTAIGGILGGIAGAYLGQKGGEAVGNVASDALADDPKKVLGKTPEGKAILGVQTSLNRVERKVNTLIAKKAIDFKGTYSGKDPKKLGDTEKTETPADVAPKKEEEGKGFFGTISSGIQSFAHSAATVGKDAWDAAKKLGGQGIDKLSSYFESGNKGAGAISSGRGDHGGASYGTHQFASANGSLQGYLQNSKYGKEFNGLAPGSAEFNSKWKDIADKDPKGFEADQAQYTTAKYFVPQQKKLADAGLDVSKRSKALQSAVYSASVQFGGNSDIILNALKAQNIDPKSAKDEDIINAIYQYKMDNNSTLFKSSSTAVQQGTLNRAATEKQTVLNTLQEERKNPNSGAQTPAQASKPSVAKKPGTVGSNRPKMTMGTNSSPSTPGMNRGSGRGQGTSIFSGISSGLSSFFKPMVPGFMAGVDRTTSALGAGYDAIKSFVGNALKPADPSVNISGVQPAVLGNLNAMASDYAKRTGQPLQINSGYRASAKQAALYQADLAKNGGQPSGKVAPPGSSLHNYGMAVDVNSTAGNYLQQSGMLDAYGFTRPMPGEPWHLEPKGINRTNVKNNPAGEAAKVQQNAKPAVAIKDVKPPQSGGNDVSKRKTESAGPPDKGFQALVAKKKPQTATASVASSSGGSPKTPAPVVAKPSGLAGNVVKPTGTPGVTPVVVDNTPTDASASAPSSSGSLANVCNATPLAVTPSADIKVSSQNDKLDSTADKPQAPVVINNTNNTSSQGENKGSSEFGMSQVAGPNPYTIALMTF
jgi:hypothetical protein